MKSEKLLKKIGVILNELQDQYDYIMENQGVCNELEFTLFLTNAEFLAENTKILIQLKQSEASKIDSLFEVDDSNQFDNNNTSEKDSSEKKMVKDVLTEDESLLAVINPEKSNFISNEEIIKPTIENNFFDEVVTNPIAESISIEEEGPEPFLIHKDDSMVANLAQSEIVEQVNPQYSSINDMFQKKQEALDGAKIESPKLLDLKQGINLNDKLLYIKDLFNGYNLAYAEALEIANKLPNFEAADSFFKNNYAEKYNWNEKSDTVEKFYKLLNSRF